MNQTPSFPLIYSNEVKAALDAGRPVVALESTIITHGMPWPGNLDMANDVEDIIRAQGAVPATIAVLDGSLHIGLEKKALEVLSHSQNAMKVSRADLPFAIATKRTGGTTVAATMIAAALAGIRVFATGGIGGVHFGAEQSFDISADLEELARTPVIVVSAGAKAILDIPKTLEVLETKGVPVVTYRSDELPAFWSRKSGLTSPLRLHTAQEIAHFQNMRTAMNIGGGMLIANPVAAADEIPASQMQGYINQALEKARSKGISGKQVTPFLLSEILTITDGASLVTNIALVKNNAHLAAAIACALSD